MQQQLQHMLKNNRLCLYKKHKYTKKKTWNFFHIDRSRIALCMKWNRRNCLFPEGCRAQSPGASIWTRNVHRVRERGKKYSERVFKCSHSTCTLRHTIQFWLCLHMPSLTNVKKNSIKDHGRDINLWKFNNNLY